MWREIWISSVILRHFIQLRWGFHCKYCFSVTKMPVPFWTLLFKFLVLLLKIGVKKSQKYLYNVKNIKKTTLQLGCSNVLLHLMKYKVLCEPEIKLKNLRGGKALAMFRPSCNRDVIPGAWNLNLQHGRERSSRHHSREAFTVTVSG